MFKGKTDVVVTDGFTGNIVLKTGEGFADTFQSLLGMGQSFRVDSQLQGSALVHYIDLTSMAKRIDYKEYGGACLLGVNGNVIVAHVCCSVCCLRSRSDNTNITANAGKSKED